MNRAWAAFFGRGMVATLEDFGTRGEEPTHPELLDWLAVEFMERGWSVKAMHRLIVTSATYRQRSGSPLLAGSRSAEPAAGRGPRVRVDAEIVRDIALSASGLLDRQIGGPSVYPPQPAGATALAYGMTPWPTSQGPSAIAAAFIPISKGPPRTPPSSRSMPRPPRRPASVASVRTRRSRPSRS